jgi:hypothetical protein
MWCFWICAEITKETVRENKNGCNEMLGIYKNMIMKPQIKNRDFEVYYVYV